ncbi:hypothetical protein [Sorangium cellulosum]|uniref:Uncharacterized protein n=1 Tax=Sorangium cellulosum TaxID=56 RepID=A0A150QU85_SORCE|nr:hypothetical protein [Sorangium cellulosum]KYF71559.1 hypothetical protein BE15_21745 [Sorangium cellulosum]
MRSHSRAPLPSRTSRGEAHVFRGTCARTRSRFDDGILQIHRRLSTQAPKRFADLLQTIHPDDHEFAEAGFRHAARPCEFADLEYRLVRLDLEPADRRRLHGAGPVTPGLGPPGKGGIG